MTAVRTQIRKLLAERAAIAARAAARPRLTGTPRAVRVCALMIVADDPTPTTPRKRRACRVADLMKLAADRAALC